MKSEWRGAPNPPIERVRQRDQRPRRIVLDDGRQIAGIRQRGVLDDQPVIVVDERIIEGVDVDEPGKQHRDRATDRAAAAKS